LKCVCDEELDILVAALRVMAVKWPGAEMILRTVGRLRKGGADTGTATPTVGRGGEGRAITIQQLNSDTGDDSLSERDHLSMASLHGLFPFPSEICPRMDLLDDQVRDEPFAAAAAVASMPHNLDDWDWIFDEFTELGHGWPSVLD
jgi:hypothetical protein